MNKSSNSFATPQRIFGLWTGDNSMNDNRRRGWESFGVTGLEPVLVTPANLNEWIAPGCPLHPAYPYLSLVHRSDYLRPYFMYHHGGGFADIKPQGGSWLPTLAALEARPHLYGAGYREVRGGTVWLQNAPINGRYLIGRRDVPRFAATAMTNLMRAARPLLIGNCAYYFKPRTRFAKLWLREVERRLDLVLDQLRAVESPDIRARFGDGSSYPLPWSSIHGDVLQPLALRHFARLARTLPRPVFTDYS